MKRNPNHKEITDYFRSNIFEAISAYNGWKMLSHSRSNKVVSDEMAKRYVEIQKYHPNFFVTAERAFLVNFVLMTLHPFDRNNDSHSLYKVDKGATDEFVKNHESVIGVLRALRNKLFAHKDSRMGPKDQLIVPAVKNQDKFFEDLINFYNNLTSKVDRSSTSFTNAEEIKRDIELLFINLYRGEAVRMREIDIKYDWQEDRKKASDVI